jgi:hypothetical protein
MVFWVFTELWHELSRIKTNYQFSKLKIYEKSLDMGYKNLLAYGQGLIFLA